MAKAAAAPVSRAAMMTRGALLVYLQPRLAMDQRPHTMKIVDRATQGVTSANFRKLAPQVINALRRSVQGRLAQDGLGIDDLAQMLSALQPQAEQADQAPGLGQIASNPGGSAGPMTATANPDNGPGGGESSDIIAKIKAYLEQEGVAPEILNNLDAFLAEHQPAGPAPPPAPGAPPAPPAGGPGGPGGPDQGLSAGRDAGGLQGLGGGAVGGMSTGGMGPGGGLDAPPPPPGALDQEGTEGLVEGGNNGGSWADLDPRGGTENDLKPESAEDASMDNLPEAFRDDDDEGEDEAEDELVPGEQDEQLEGTPTVSSKGKMSRYVGGGGGGEDRAITKSAMDKAIRIAQDAAIKTQRDIRQAERFVRPWVGDMAMDDARHFTDVYRAALQALGVKGVDKVHRDALRPILEAQPYPSARVVRDQQYRLAADSAPGKAGGSFADRFPDAMKITIQ